MMNETIRVLLIEDNPGDARLIREILQSENNVRFAVHHATSLQAGMLAIRTDYFDAILVDLSLPDSFGMETLLKVHQETPPTPVIVLTGFADRQIGLRALQYGAQDYLVKDDTDSNLLARSIQYAIERKRIEAAEQEQRRFAEALRQTAALLTSTLDLNEVLDRMLANIEHVVPHDAANIVLLEDEYAYIARRRDNGKRDTDEIVAEGRLQLTGSPLLAQMQQTQRPVIIGDLQAAGSDTLSGAAEANVRSYAGVPIYLHEETIGFINIFCFAPNRFNRADSDRLMAFAEHAAIAIQNARLYTHSRELASIQERQRLARELHDSVTSPSRRCASSRSTPANRAGCWRRCINSPRTRWQRCAYCCWNCARRQWRA
jgi:DNA-binding NarL/FixJ family response regulator